MCSGILGDWKLFNFPLLCACKGDSLGHTARWLCCTQSHFQWIVDKGMLWWYTKQVYTYSMSLNHHLLPFSAKHVCVWEGGKKSKIYFHSFWKKLMNFDLLHFWGVLKRQEWLEVLRKVCAKWTAVQKFLKNHSKSVILEIWVIHQLHFAALRYRFFI